MAPIRTYRGWDTAEDIIFMPVQSCSSSKFAAKPYCFALSRLTGPNPVLDVPVVCFRYCHSGTFNS